MIFDKKAELLRFATLSDGVLGWQTVKSLPVKVEVTGKNNLFSKVGIGAKTALLTLRGTGGVTLADALRVDGQFYFLTDVQREGLLLTVTAAMVSLVECVLLRADTSVDVCKRPIHGEPRPVLTFPAVLTEKYLGFTQGEPMAQTETTFVLVTPKAVTLTVGDLVETGGGRFAVQICHPLDAYKNEYEIHRKADA